jgi:hypothetical protein
MTALVLLALAAWTGYAVELHNLRTGRPYEMTAHKCGSAGPVCFSHDGRRLAVAGDRTVTVFDLATRRARLRLSGQVGPDGGQLATGSTDTTAIVWDLSGREWSRYATRRPNRADWDSLSSAVPEEAWRTMARLVCRPREAVALLHRHLRPARGKGLTDAAVGRLIGQLGSDDFETRHGAEMALRDAVAGHEAQLLRALRKATDLEVKLRLRRILVDVSAWPGPELLRPRRALEVLERLGTPEARKLLRVLAAGNADARLTLEARATLKRLERKP